MLCQDCAAVRGSFVPFSSLSSPSFLIKVSARSQRARHANEVVIFRSFIPLSSSIHPHLLLPMYLLFSFGDLHLVFSFFLNIISLSLIDITRLSSTLQKLFMIKWRQLATIRNKYVCSLSPLPSPLSPLPSPLSPLPSPLSPLPSPLSPLPSPLSPLPSLIFSFSSFFLSLGSSSSSSVSSVVVHTVINHIIVVSHLLFTIKYESGSMFLLLFSIL